MTSPEELTLDGSIAIHDECQVEEDAKSPAENDLVRMTQDIPELGLRRGDLGVVRSRWLAPTRAYEIEFHLFGAEYSSRGLLMAGQIELAERKRQQERELCVMMDDYADVEEAAGKMVA
jgi:hypothetical protein